MTINRVERAIVNHSLRALAQREVEARVLLAMGGRVPGARALEIGCGRGIGVEVILDRFGASSVDAFDLDPAMVDMARRRNEGRPGVRLWTGDATRIDAPDASYDAVFDFAIVHHVPAWRDALAEVARVLRPGGRLFAEELFERFILHPVWRRLLDHPLHDRFDHDRFASALEAAGFRAVRSLEIGPWWAWFVAERANDR